MVATIEKIKTAKPFLRWAGGKQKLIPHLPIPKDFTHYLEPMVGAGAMLFYILEMYPDVTASISDINSDLIWTYKALRSNPETLIQNLKKFEKFYLSLNLEGKEKFYLNTRDKFNLGSTQNIPAFIDRATLFIFLNKTCFNGLYRVRRDGGFNTSFGKLQNPTICDEENLIRCSELLKRVTISKGSFDQWESNKNTFIYLDPPYIPTNGNFTAYNKEGFGKVENEKLLDYIDKQSENGAAILLSNSKTDFWNSLELIGFGFKEIQAARMINSDASKRGCVTELAIYNYQT